MNNSKDVLAKLLSTEDVQVVRAEVPTASFDVKNRVLTLPTFVNLNENIENLMIGHEVGHALWTPEKGVTEEMAKDKLLKQYANVIEDVRIEKMIQAEYPGLRQDFLQGYKKLADDDFFGIGKKDINSLNLIDKINLYFKIGLKSGIKFSKEEFEIASRVDSCKTFKEVIALAKELSNYSRKKKQEEEEAKIKANADILNELEDEDLEEEEMEQDADYDYDDFETDPDLEKVERDDSDSEESDDPESSGGYMTKAGEHQADETPADFQNPYDYYDDDLMSTTQTAMDEKMKEHAKFDGKIFRNVEIPEFPLGIDPIITYKEIIADLERPSEDPYTDNVGKSSVDRMMNDENFITDTGNYVWCDNIYEADTFEKYNGRKYLGPKSGAYYKDDYNKFVEGISKDIDFMVKEFEMKKSAQRYARTEIAKTGQLNVNKLYNYKLSEDIFKRVNVVADDKNHGFIMLVDWSGSMHNVMRDTMRQVIVLSTFCRKVNIPFQVLAFSNHDNLYNQDKEKSDERWIKVAKQRAEDMNDLHYLKRQTMWLYELLTHEMNQKDFDKMCFYMHSFMWHYDRAYSLSGTPLTEALECSVGIVGRFIKKHNIDKMNFITLTDGAGWSSGIQDNYDRCRATYGESWNDGRFRRQYTDTLIDPMTKKKYLVAKRGDGAYDFAYLDAISKRYNCATIGYYIGRNTRDGMRQFGHYNVQDKDWGYDHLKIEETRVQCRKNNGWVSIKDCGRDEMFFLDSRKLNPASQEIEVDGNKSAAQIARQFSKGLKQNRQSKVLMSTFVERVA